jgi:aspartate/methionine/tyrosine aminotransferase
VPQVICIEPFFDAYANGARLAEAKVVGVPLRPKGPNASHNSADWHIDVAELEAAITSRTKIVCGVEGTRLHNLCIR